MHPYEENRDGNDVSTELRIELYAIILVGMLVVAVIDYSRGEYYKNSVGRWEFVGTSAYWNDTRLVGEIILNVGGAVLPFAVGRLLCVKYQTLFSELVGSFLANIPPLVSRAIASFLPSFYMEHSMERYRSFF